MIISQLSNRIHQKDANIVLFVFSLTFITFNSFFKYVHFTIFVSIFN
jgi:hypothetical protein